MEERIKINVMIAERNYPMTITRKEELIIRNAVKNINESIKDIELKYAVRDKQDALSMCLLKYASKNISMKFYYEEEEKILQIKIDNLLQQIHSIL